jgi:hypothetical protein
MTRDEHIQAHKQLHRSFDLLLADFIWHNPGMRLRTTSILALMEWSHSQTINPTVPAGERYDEPDKEKTT